MLTLTFIILVYSVLLKPRDLNIIKATAQHWMLNGTTGMRYRIVFATKAFVKNFSVDEIWIHNRFYKVNTSFSSAVYFENESDEKVLSVDLSEEPGKSSDPVAEQLKKFIPGDVAPGSGDVVIAYKVGNKKKYHIIEHLEQLPYAASF